MPVMGFTKFERFFRAAGGVSVDRDDIKRYLDFVNDAIYDLLLVGQATAKANARDIIEPWDLPVTKGLQESTRARSVSVPCLRTTRIDDVLVPAGGKRSTGRIQTVTFSAAGG
jgi:hypothetical protein